LKIRERGNADARLNFVVIFIIQPKTDILVLWMAYTTMSLIDNYGHLVAGRLKPEEMKLVAELARNLVLPRNIMSTSKERAPDNVTNKKQIYNARHRLKMKERGPRNEMQHFLHCLEQKNCLEIYVQ
jgi:hypothetical protein